MRATAAVLAASLAVAGLAGAAEAPIPAPPAEDGAVVQAEDAVAEVLRFMLGRPSRVAGADDAAADPDALEAALAELALARVVAEVHDAPALQLALAVFDAAAAAAPLTPRRDFAADAVLAGSHRILPALNAAIDRVERALPGYSNAATFRRFAADPAARREEALALPALAAIATSRAVAAAPFALLEALERCGTEGGAVPPRALAVTLALVAPDLYGFYRRTLADPAAPAPAAARDAFIRNLRAAAQRCRH